MASRRLRLRCSAWGHVRASDRRHHNPDYHIAESGRTLRSHSHWKHVGWTVGVWSAIRTQVSRGLWRWRAFYELRVIRPKEIGSNFTESDRRDETSSQRDGEM
jgi:hypothetical protein